MKRPIDIGNGVGYGQMFGASPADYKQFGLSGHHGADYPSPIGKPIYAPESGKITISSNGARDQYTGNTVSGEVIVLRGLQYEHWLLHLNSRLVTAGQHVSEGQHIGYSGNTGYSIGPHLHWGVRPLNPNIQNGYRGFIDPTIALNTPVAPPPPLWTVSAIIPKQVRAKSGTRKWNLGHGTFNDVANNPLATANDTTIFTAVAILRHREIPQYNYYVENASTPQGWNVLDCEDYIAPAPSPPPPPAPPAAPVPVPRIETYQLVTPVLYYPTAKDAVHDQNAISVLQVRKEPYIVFTRDKDMINLTDDNRYNRNWWINSRHNVVPVPEPKPEPVQAAVITPPLPDKVKDVIIKASEDIPAAKGVSDMATDWKKCTPLKTDTQGRWQPVKYRSTNDMVQHIRSLDGKMPGTIPLPPHKTLSLVCTFMFDGIVYARDDLLMSTHRYYALPLDMFDEVKQEAPVQRMDIDHDGDVDINDYQELVFKYLRPGIDVVARTVKTINNPASKPRRFIDGVIATKKRDKVQ